MTAEAAETPQNTVPDPLVAATALADRLLTMTLSERIRWCAQAIENGHLAATCWQENHTYQLSDLGKVARRFFRARQVLTEHALLAARLDHDGAFRLLGDVRTALLEDLT